MMGEYMATEKWHSGRMIYVLARHFDWWSNPMLTEFDLCGGRCDLAFVSKSGYVTEIEIKVSLSDWNADRDKQKWTKPRPYISRFFYAVPETLADKIPDWLPDHAGVLSVESGGIGYDRVRIIREAKRLKAEKLPQKQIDQFMRNCYYRFWRSQINHLGNRIAREKNRQPPSPQVAS
jgi:hypothetical protein